MNFVGEFLILVGGFDFNPLIIIFSSLGMILTLIYSLALYNRLFFGPLYLKFIRYYSEISRLEFYVLFFLVLIIIFFGLYPVSFISI